MLTPEQRSQRARIAAHARWAKECDRVQHGRRAQAGLMRKFLLEVDPKLELPEDERWRRAESLRKSHMARLSFMASKARAARKGAA
jgi:hypothetical protein